MFLVLPTRGDVPCGLWWILALFPPTALGEVIMAALLAPPGLMLSQACDIPTARCARTLRLVANDQHERGEYGADWHA